MASLHRWPTLPEYYRDRINKNVDLLSEPKQCCPFHKEDSPSFVYSREKQICSCFGGCKLFGMDVIALHQRNYDITTREEAKRSLAALYGIEEKVKLQSEPVEHLLNDDRIYQEQIYQKALILAGANVDRWIEMDYIMSKVPLEVIELKVLVDKWESSDKSD